MSTLLPIQALGGRGGLWKPEGTEGTDEPGGGGMEVIDWVRVRYPGVSVGEGGGRAWEGLGGLANRDGDMGMGMDCGAC